ncbi:alpha-1,4-glucan--maltose-1-phosphate maltosyltransferase [Blastococcus sp. Marseille-P5729]|uniref:alpha-1,4-glucan--maltose-1-phosphate maltosyltransferase n=1 Tax=Blastococcus sp. Marseille-P5729 TaxID=2086582 RepID=UPI000D0F008C|nr:alpha-1,4-glucan--maltose-1-phosphate maltosyltransferase [Blastococcus sp. Marseille-P5729]
MDAARIEKALSADRIGITDISPVVDDGRFPARCIDGQVVTFWATVFREGHDAVGATAVLSKDGQDVASARMRPVGIGTDRWSTDLSIDGEGEWEFRIEAWGDPWATVHHAITAKREAGQGADELANDLALCATILERAAADLEGTQAAVLRDAALRVADASLPIDDRLAAVLGERVGTLMHESPLRELVTASPRYRIWADRARAAVGAWYELFPRSTGGWDEHGRPVHGTFTTAAAALDRVAAMGFDVVYLPPIHPVGEINRKGPNNTLTPGPDDCGSPWAVGSKDGGHDAVHPDLGTIDDFDAFVDRAGELGLEIALDLALQCAPDHPWVAEHPEWFTTLADGTIAYAENPPKKYQDIYPLNFDNDPVGLYKEVYRVVRFWVEHGVHVFRVDNPHTKPINFWNWLIWEIKRDYPDVVFLAEAFTRPAMMKGLGMRGFSQSYTYFTWRTEKWELEEFGRDLVDSAAYLNPNMFVNTPDILHATLQYGGPDMFKIRAVLASMMSGSWGVYSGYELFEHVAVKAGSEEYLDSEKYQLRPRDWQRARDEGRSLEPFLTQLNEIRRAHPAVSSSIANLQFHHSDNDAIIVFSRRDARTGDTVLVACSLDSHHTQQTTVRLNMPALGLGWNDRFTVIDELTGAEYEWGEANFVELGPAGEPAHIFQVRQ